MIYLINAAAILAEEGVLGDTEIAKELTWEMEMGEKFLRNAPSALLDLLIRVVICVVVFVVGTRLIQFIRKFVANALNRGNASREAKQFLDSALKLGLYCLLVFQIAIRLGIDATSIATLLGSAAVTIGLAFQGSLKNCIGGIMIMLLHPFGVGDYIVEGAGHNEGSVQEISIFYTKLATLDNKIILLPNGNLADACIINVTRAEHRRLELKVGISYTSDIRTAKAVLEELLLKNEKICKDKEYMIYVDELGDSSVVIGLRCWTKTGDYFATRCELLEEIKYAFDEKGIGIPFPQLDVHLG